MSFLMKLCCEKGDGKESAEIEERIRQLHALNSDLDSPQILYWSPSTHEKELLKHSWSEELEFLYNIGTKIYVYIFEHCPNTKKLFDTIHAIGEKYAESEAFRGQALKFAQDALEYSLSEHIYSIPNFSDEKRQDAIAAWRKLAKYTITHMKKGYVSGLVKEFYKQEANFNEWVKHYPGMQPID